MARSRKQHQCPSSQQVVGNGARLHVLLVGGNGGMVDRYREAAESSGFSLTHAEHQLKRGNTMAAYCAVVIIINPNSHPLREAAATLATSLGLEAIYVRTGSVSMVEAAFVGIRAALDVAAVAAKRKK